jgi:hypothetical protein
VPCSWDFVCLELEVIGGLAWLERNRLELECFFWIKYFKVLCLCVCTLSCVNARSLELIKPNKVLGLYYLMAMNWVKGKLSLDEVRSHTGNRK